MFDLLAGVRVIEWATLLNGDICGMILGDLGADVIKIESPGVGDHVRDIMGLITPRNSPYHLQVNRNKRSIALNLKDPDDLEVFWKLQEKADVFVDGHVAGAADRLGIGYDPQARRNPRIVYCQVTGFGSVGPYSTIPTHGRLQSAVAGALPMHRGPDGRPELDPPSGRGVRDSGSAATPAATYGALATAAALVKQRVSGTGAYIDIAGSDAVIAQAWNGEILGINESRITDWTGLEDGGRQGSGGSGGASAKYNFYETRDGKFVGIACTERKFWNAFCDGVGRPDLRAEGGSHDNEFDWGRESSLMDTVAEIMASRTQQEWTDFAVAHRVPIGPVNRPTELDQDPHLRVRGIFFEENHPVAGPFTHIAEPMVIRGQHFGVRYPAPAVGEQTAEIKAELDAMTEEVEV
jgi:crotonobetainyl-CoA:carnitine CoA-transferase CaiB-like acyl-CoA transferase